jgi:hypothetical protein
MTYLIMMSTPYYGRQQINRWIDRQMGACVQLKLGDRPPVVHQSVSLSVGDSFTCQLLVRVLGGRHSGYDGRCVCPSVTGWLRAATAG